MIESAAFAGAAKVARQRMVYRALSEELAGPEWEFIVYRMLSIETIRSIATAALRSRPRTEVVAEGRRLGVPIAPMNSPEEFVEEEQTRARGYFQRTGFPHLGNAPFAGAPFIFSSTSVGVVRPAPPVGGDPQASQLAHLEAGL